MMKLYDILINYVIEDELLVDELISRINNIKPTISIKKSLITSNNNKKQDISQSKIYLLYLTDSIFNNPIYLLDLKEDISYAINEENSNNLIIEMVSNSKEFIYNDLNIIHSDSNKQLVYDLTRGYTWTILNKSNYMMELNKLLFFIEDDLKEEEDSKYKYDCFISWTGGDWKTKCQIVDYLKEKNLTVYDSEYLCHNKFYSNFTKALHKSKVYILLLSDKLNNQKVISDVRKEIEIASQLEQRIHSNIEILTLSKEFKEYEYGMGNDIYDYFYDITRPFHFIDATSSKEENGFKILDEETLDKLYERIVLYIEARSNNKPIFYYPDFGIKVDRTYEASDFFGRDKELQNIEDAFYNDKYKAVILSGVGGVGKSKIAERFAQIVSEKDRLFHLQTIRVSDITINSKEDAFSIILNSIKYSDYYQEKIDSISDPILKKEYQISILKKLPERVLIIVDNINNLDKVSVERIVNEINARFIFTSRSNLLDSKDICNIEILPFLAKDIYFEFKNRSGLDDLNYDDFSKIYDAFSGNTMCIFILSTLAKKNGYTKEELLDVTSSISKSKDEIRVLHNDINENLSIIGMLKKLFDISYLSIKSQDILYELSLLKDGIIPIKLFKQYFNLDSNNEINELIENGGWIKKINQYLEIHPFVSKVLPEVNPSKISIDKCEHILNYINDNYDLNGLYLTLDTIYFALYKLNYYSHEIDKRLWEKFEKMSVLLYDDQDMINRTNTLLENIKDENAIDIYKVLRSNLVLKYNPLEISEFESLLAGLEKSSSSDVELIIRTISIHLNSFMNYNVYSRQIISILVKSFETLINKSLDDIDYEQNKLIQLELMYLYMYLCRFDAKHARKLMIKYFKTAKKKNNNSIYLYYGYLAALSPNLLNKVNSYFSSDSSTPLNRFLFHTGINNLIVHPVTFFKQVHLSSIIIDHKIESPDEVFIYNLYKLLDSITVSETINLESLIESAVNYYEYLLNNNLTMLKKEEFINNLLIIISRILDKTKDEYLLEKYREEFLRIAHTRTVNINEITSSSDIAELTVSSSILLMFNDKKALEQSKSLYLNSKNKYKNNSLYIFMELYDYITVLNSFGEYSDIDIYIKEFFDLAEKLDIKNDKVGNVFCIYLNSLLKTYNKSAYDMPYNKRIYLRSLEGASSTELKIQIEYSYIRISLLSKNSDTNKHFLNFLELLKSKNRLNKLKALEYLYNLTNYIDNTDTQKEFLRVLYKYKRSNNLIVRERATIIYMFAKTTFKENIFDDLHSAKSYTLCLKESVNNNIGYLVNPILNKLFKCVNTFEDFVNITVANTKDKKKYIELSNCPIFTYEAFKYYVLNINVDKILPHKKISLDKYMAFLFKDILIEQVNKYNSDIIKEEVINDLILSELNTNYLIIKNNQKLDINKKSFYSFENLYFEGSLEELGHYNSLFNLYFDFDNVYVLNSKDKYYHLSSLELNEKTKDMKLGMINTISEVIIDDSIKEIEFKQLPKTINNLIYTGTLQDFIRIQRRGGIRIKSFYIKDSVVNTIIGSNFDSIPSNCFEGIPLNYVFLDKNQEIGDYAFSNINTLNFVLISKDVNINSTVFNNINYNCVFLLEDHHLDDILQNKKIYYYNEKEEPETWYKLDDNRIKIVHENKDYQILIIKK